MEREEKIKALEEVLDLKAPLETLKKYSKYSQFIKIPTPYSIERIRKGFALYENREITKEYFFLWCNLCGRVIEKQCIEYCHSDAAKQEISWRLFAVANGVSPEEMLAEIEDLHLIVSGERESNLWLAKEMTYFCLTVGENDYGEIYDVIILDSRRKNYVVSLGVDDMDLDSMDAFEEIPNVSYVSEDFFNLLLKMLTKLGYEKKDEV